MILFISGLAAGLLIGAGVFYFATLGGTIRLRERAKTLEEQLLSEKALKTQLQNEFKLAASEALFAANEQFLNSAIKDLRFVQTESSHELENKKEAIANFVSDMKSRLEDYQKIVKRFEEERFSMYAKMEQSISQVLSAEQSIRMETGALKRVLTSSSGVRGKWGEKILEEILEQNNFIKGINFDTQVALSSEDAQDLRPDFVIKLPGNKRLIVDCKEVVSEYVFAQDTDDTEKQKVHYEKLVANIRNNFTKLSRKEYQSFLDPDIPFVVMFIPSEAAIRAAFATDPELFGQATEKKVILASPMTIIPLLYLIKHGWTQQRLAQNAKELGLAVEELGKRLNKFIEHLVALRGGIKKAADSWDKAMSSWQKRISPQIEKTKTLGGRLEDSEDLKKIESDFITAEEDVKIPLQ